jgi:predicted RNA methylase
VDLGSGCGRTTLGAAALFPALGKVTGIEFLPELVKLSNGYRGKVRGRKASAEFVSGDFNDPGEASEIFRSLPR